MGDVLGEVIEHQRKTLQGTVTGSTGGSHYRTTESLARNVSEYFYPLFHVLDCSHPLVDGFTGNPVCVSVESRDPLRSAGN